MPFRELPRSDDDSASVARARGPISKRSFLVQTAMDELLLSSTLSTCSLPTTTLHSLQTGSLLFSFKSPVNSTSSTASNPNQAAGAEVNGAGGSGLGMRNSMGYVEGSDGTGGVIIGLGGKEGRAGVNVWGFQKVRSPAAPSERH